MSALKGHIVTKPYILGWKLRCQSIFLPARFTFLQFTFPRLHPAEAVAIQILLPRIRKPSFIHFCTLFFENFVTTRLNKFSAEHSLFRRERPC